MIQEYLKIFESGKEKEEKNFVQKHPYITSAASALTGVLGATAFHRVRNARVKLNRTAPSGTVHYPEKNHQDRVIPVSSAQVSKKKMEDSSGWLVNSYKSNPKKKEDVFSVVPEIKKKVDATIPETKNNENVLKAYSVPPAPGSVEWRMMQDNPVWTIDPKGRKEKHANEYYAKQFVKLLPGSRLATLEEVKSKRKTGFVKPPADYKVYSEKELGDWIEKLRGIGRKFVTMKSIVQATGMSEDTIAAKVHALDRSNLSRQSGKNWKLHPPSTASRNRKSYVVYSTPEQNYEYYMIEFL